MTCYDNEESWLAIDACNVDQVLRSDGQYTLVSETTSTSSTLSPPLQQSCDKECEYFLCEILQKCCACPS